MKLDVTGFLHGDAIPEKYALGRKDAENHVALSDNRNPGISWTNLPQGTRSLALICVDPDVPSKPDDVNQEGREVPADLPRVDFYHWVLVDIDPSRGAIKEGEACDGVTAKGKAVGATPLGVQGLNNYTDWFAGDADMGGDYGGYDGPCPPWNDSILHHYHFRLYALDVESLGLDGRFGGPEALAAMEGHILGQTEVVGTYTLNPAVG